MKRMKRLFDVVRGRFCALLPASVTQHLTLGSAWYDSSSFRLYHPGDRLEVVSPWVFGFGLNPVDWTVLGYTDDGHYRIEEEDGKEHVHFRWSIENYFRLRRFGSRPLDPNRFTVGYQGNGYL